MQGYGKASPTLLANFGLSHFQSPHILQACSIWNWLAANGFISLSELYIWMHGTFGHFVFGHCAFTALDIELPTPIQIHFAAL